VLIKETKEYEIHSFYDIPSVVLATIKVLIERKDGKQYIIFITKDRMEETCGKS